MFARLTCLIAALPFFVSASSATISLTKRSALAPNGVVDPVALQAHAAHVQAKIAQGFSNFKQNTGAAHPADRKIMKRAAESLPLNASSEVYHGPISVGTPPEVFQVQFDTGSAFFFLPGDGCTTNCSGHKIYNTSASSTAKKAGSAFNITQPDGAEVKGDQFTDTVSIGNLTAKGQTIGVAKQYAGDFASSKFAPDGVMGMAFPTVSSGLANTTFQTLLLQGQTDAVFGLSLSASSPSLDLGAVDTSKFKGPLTNVSVTNPGFWFVNLTSVNVGDKNITGGTGILSAIIDTGSRFISGDVYDVITLYGSIPGSKVADKTVGNGFWTVPCDAIPDVSFCFGDQDFHMSAESFNMGQVSQGSSDCVGAVTAHGLGTWIVGTAFLENVYTAFDVGNSVVGFANLA